MSGLMDDSLSEIRDEMEYVTSKTNKSVRWKTYAHKNPFLRIVSFSDPGSGD